MGYVSRKVEKVAFACEPPIFVRELSAAGFAEASEVLAGIESMPPPEKLWAMATLCLLCCVTEEGAPAFETAEAVLEEPFALLEACAEAALSVNGLTEDAPGGN